MIASITITITLMWVIWDNSVTIPIIIVTCVSSPGRYHNFNNNNCAQLTLKTLTIGGEGQ